MTNGMKDEATPMTTGELQAKCIEDLTREFSKAIEERDDAMGLCDIMERRWHEAAEKAMDQVTQYKQLSEQYAKAITDLNELRGACAKALDGPHSDVETSIEHALAKHKEKE